MSYLSSKILNLTKQLFPNGRAFWVPATTEEVVIYTDENGDLLTDEDGDFLTTEDSEISGGIFERFLKSFAGDGANRLGTLERLINDTDSTLDSLLPDNENFTDGTTDPLDNDCDDWERRLGLIQYGVTDSPTRLQRMAAIATKMRYPGTDAPRQSAEYLRDQLLSAGFAVVVYENINNVDPATILGIPVGRAYYGAFDYGEVDYGELWATHDIRIIANHIDEDSDADFVFPPGNFHGAFYIFGIGGFGDYANIPLTRKAEFRQMILRLKPGNMVGIGFIHYV